MHTSCRSLVQAYARDAQRLTHYRFNRALRGSPCRALVSITLGLLRSLHRPAQAGLFSYIVGIESLVPERISPNGLLISSIVASNLRQKVSPSNDLRLPRFSGVFLLREMLRIAKCRVESGASDLPSTQQINQRNAGCSGNPGHVRSETPVTLVQNTHR